MMVTLGPKGKADDCVEVVEKVVEVVRKKVEESRRVVVEKIRTYFDEHFVGENSHAACLYWAKATCIVLAKLGVRSILQGGTASWQMVPPELDDGVQPTQFTYKWEGLYHPETLRLISEGGMPEMHVWAAVPDVNMIIDVTTGFQEEQCKKMIGCDWVAEPLPDYMWFETSEVPSGTYYHPDEKATRLCYALLEVSEWGE